VVDEVTRAAPTIVGGGLGARAHAPTSTTNSKGRESAARWCARPSVTRNRRDFRIAPERRFVSHWLDRHPEWAEELEIVAS
jgi:hypothetical protein